MKKKIILGLVVLITLFTITGCGKSYDNENKSEESVKNVVDGEKVEFTEPVSNDVLYIEYKMPKGSDSINEYKDEGKNVVINIDNVTPGSQTLRMYDEKVDEIKTTVINGHTYEYLKFKMLDDWIIYFYRTTMSSSVAYYFEFNVYAKEYDDLQIEKFMNTVSYKE